MNVYEEIKLMKRVPADLQQEIQALLDENARLMREAEEAESEVADDDETETHIELDSLQDELDAAENANEELERQIRSLENEVAKVEGQVEYWRGKYEALASGANHRMSERIGVIG